MALTTGVRFSAMDDVEYAYVAEDVCPPPSAGGWLKVYCPALQLPDKFAIARSWTERIDTKNLLANSPNCAPTVSQSITVQNYLEMSMERNCEWPDSYLYYVENEGYHTITGKKLQATFPYGNFETRHFNTNLPD